MKKLLKSDKITLGLCALAAMVCLYVLSQDLFSNKKRDSSERQIASVDRIVNDGRVKGIEEMHFVPVESDPTLFNKDTVYSGENSYVDIKLNSGGDVKLKPNSIVVLKRKDKDLAFQLQSGHLKGKLKGQEEILLASKDSFHRLKANE
ncbi:MAG: hypothetical protein HRT44_11195, partial [Bdellovibrionales bacterium]|nr:hypothetical protein [Bdellovibrionales bacterium]